MSYNALSIDRSEALRLIRRQIEKGEALSKKGTSIIKEKSKDTDPSHVRDIFELAFTQWIDRTCSILYKIYENSRYASEFEKTYSGRREAAGLSWMPDREQHYLKKQLIQLLDYLRALRDSIGNLEEGKNEPLEGESSHLHMLMEKIQSLMAAHIAGQLRPEQSRQYEEVYEELDSLFSILKLTNPNLHSTLQEFDDFCKVHHFNNDSQRNDCTEKIYQGLMNNVFESDDVDGSSRGIKRKKAAGKITSATHPEKVFVAHGKNSRLKDDFFSFLRALHLEPIEWSQAISATGKAGPYIDDFLASVFSQAQAMVILMTPDDLVVLKKPFHREDDEADEKIPFRQPGANIIFEAGLALGYNPQRTVIIRIGHFKLFSNIYEEHVIRLDNSSIQRQEVVNRLLRAGCNINTGGSDWLSVGDFQILPAEEENRAAHNEEPQNRSFLSATMDTPDLSGEALQLLTEAVHDASCTMSIISGGMSGLSILTNGKIFGIEAKGDSWTVWDEAVRDLLDCGLIRDAGDQEDSFLVTHKGYRVADSLSKKRVHQTKRH